MNGTLTLEAIRKAVIVDCAVEEAFRLFTAEAATWWPTETHSIHGRSVGDVVFEEREGGEVYEVAENGAKGHWATVVAWDPPKRLVLEWNILEREGDVTEVEVRFEPEDGRTRVALEHRGWENVRVDAPQKRSSYDTGWDHVFGFYAGHLADGR